MRIGNKRYWLFQCCGWGAFMLIHLFFTWSFDKFQTPQDREMFFARIGMFILVGLGLTHIMRNVIIRMNLLQKNLDKQIGQLAIITLVFAVIGAACVVLVQQRFGLLTKEQRELLERGKMLLLIASNAFSVFVYYFIWNAIYFMYHYIDKSQRQQLDTLQLESMVKELELKTIKAHINPHFIFNALNSIRALVDENPARARKAITELSTILRSSMQSDKTESVAMEKELDIVRDYLALEYMRFEDRLRIEYEVEEQTLSLPVPPMMLQTLVENAIKHGISKQIEGGVVRIVSTLRDNFHELSVQNSGSLNGFNNGHNGYARNGDSGNGDTRHINGRNGEQKNETRNGESRQGADESPVRGFGLSSTTDRLTLLYGNKATFEIRQATPTLVEARVMIPVEAAN